MPARWIQLILSIDHGDPTDLEEALCTVGALAVTLQDAGDTPILEPPPGESPLWNRTQVTGLFDADSSVPALLVQLQWALNRDLPAYRIEMLPEQDWVRAWMDAFEPMRFGQRLWVCPTHHPIPDPAAVNVMLDPGWAFGTGTHPTTALCLEWLDAAVVAGKTVIDYGCGSGILAIAAAKLGASHVYAVDIDPQALLAGAQNADTNDVQERLSFGRHDALPPVAADILLANILATTLIELALRFTRLVKPRGRLVLSGILAAQAGRVQAAFAANFDFDSPRQREEWVLLAGVRRDTAIVLAES
jgi:ribosomal protein L11 methyltransferase